MKIARRHLFALGAAGLAAPALIGPVMARAEAAPTPAAMPSFTRRKLGELTVTVLLDGTLDVSNDMVIGFEQATADATLKRQHLQTGVPSLPVPALGYVIEGNGRRIAVDSGTVHGFAPRLGFYHKALAEAGIAPESIDDMLVTHLHPDHIGGLSDGAKALFPNAQVHIGAEEYDFWHSDARRDGGPEGLKPFFGVARAAVAPYDGRIKTFAREAEVLPGVLAVPLPGHTPGHAGFRFASGGEDLLIWGDVLHMTRLQFDNPDWVLVFDMDPEQTRATRHRTLDMAAADGLLISGSHIDFPGFGYVEKSGSGYRYTPAAWDYLI